MSTNDDVEKAIARVMGQVNESKHQESRPDPGFLHSNIAEVPAVIIGAEGKFSIWGVNNKLICNGSIGK
jgi:hypothetical protein